MELHKTHEPNKGTKQWESLKAFLDDVDSKVAAISAKAETVAGEAQLKAHLGLMDAEDFWQKRKQDILDVAAKLRQVQARQRDIIDTSRFELYFGKLEASEGLARLRERLEATERLISEMGEDTSADAKAALGRLRDAYEAIKAKLIQ